MTSVRIGLRGGTALAEVDAAGFVIRSNAAYGFRLLRRRTRQSALGWWVAADDRWHDPREERSRRQRLIDGTPVVETKIAVPGGDVVQRAYMVADHGGCIVMEIINESPTAVAVAVPTTGLQTDAASTPTAPQGIDLPDDVRAFPLAHRSTVRFMWQADEGLRTASTGTFSSAAQVSRGWSSATERASRITLEANSIVAARCDLLLAPAREIDDLLQADAARGVLAIAERVRMGEPAAPYAQHIADAARRVLRMPSTPWASRSLVMAARVLAHADEALGSTDVEAAWVAILGDGVNAAATRAAAASRPIAVNAQDGTLAVLSAAVDVVGRAEDSLVRALSPNDANLFADGLADAWRGVNFEAHGLVAGPRHTLSIAVRWHGPNAALLWEVDGPPGLQLRASRVDTSFVVSSQRGEGLLRVES